MTNGLTRDSLDLILENIVYIVEDNSGDFETQCEAIENYLVGEGIISVIDD